MYIIAITLTHNAVVRNKGLRLITGAFRSTPINTLHAETNIIPPNLHRPSVAYKSFLQFQQRENINLSSLFHLKEEDTNPFRNSIATIHNDVGRLNIAKLSYDSPPWQVPEINSCSFHTGTKKSTPPIALRNDFISHQNTDHKDSVGVYSDASKVDNGVGAATISHH